MYKARRYSNKSCTHLWCKRQEGIPMKVVRIIGAWEKCMMGVEWKAWFNTQRFVCSHRLMFCWLKNVAIWRLVYDIDYRFCFTILVRFYKSTEESKPLCTECIKRWLTCLGDHLPHSVILAGRLEGDDLSCVGDEGGHERRHAHAHQKLGVVVVEACQQELAVDDARRKFNDFWKWRKFFTKNFHSFDQGREHSLTLVSRYGWPPVWLVWIHPNL